MVLGIPFLSSPLQSWKEKSCAWMKLESWDTWLAKMDLKQLIFKNLPFGWMLNLFDLGWSQNAFETSWVMVMLEIVGCSVRTLEVILNHLKLHSKWRHPGSRQPKVVSWSSVFTSIELIFFSQMPWRLERKCCMLQHCRCSRGGWERVTSLPPFSWDIHLCSRQRELGWNLWFLFFAWTSQEIFIMTFYDFLFGRIPVKWEVPDSPAFMEQ